MGLTRVDFSSRIGIDNSQYGRIEDGKSNLTLEKAIQISKMFNTSLDWLLGLEESVPEKKQLDSPVIPLIPLSAMAGYGNGDSAVLYSELKEGYIIPEFTQRGAVYLIRVNGTSMEPKYSSGDILGCKPINDTTFFQWGKPYVLDTDQGPIFKRLYPGDAEEVLECRSDNHTIYPPFKISKTSIRKVAIVVGVIRME